MAEMSYYQLATQVKDRFVSKTFYQALKDHDWIAAVDKERAKFEINNHLAEVPYTGQHLVPMMWQFTIKTDGTEEARLVGRGDMMILWSD